MKNKRLETINNFILDVILKLTEEFLAVWNNEFGSLLFIIFSKIHCKNKAWIPGKIINTLCKNSKNHRHEFKWSIDRIKTTEDKKEIRRSKTKFVIIIKVCIEKKWASRRFINISRSIQNKFNRITSNPRSTSERGKIKPLALISFSKIFFFCSANSCWAHCSMWLKIILSKWKKGIWRFQLFLNQFSARDSANIGNTCWTS